jgi:gluconolactonase
MLEKGDLVHNVLEVKVVQGSLDHPECLAFGPSGGLYAGGEAGQIYRIGLEAKTCEEIANIGGFVGGIALDGDENLYACSMMKHSVLKVSPDGNVTTFCDKVAQDPLRTPNFGVFHPGGDLYFTDSGSYRHSDGRLVRVHRDGTSESLLGDYLNFPNGLALSSDASTLYMIESTSAKISAVTIESDGSVSRPETYVQLQGTVPDGMAFDRLGNLYVGCYTPDVIFKIDARRNVTTLVEDKTSEVLNRPTNVAFRPIAGDTNLYFANLGWWHIGSLDVGVSGQPLNYPKIA